jgi:hypothetical protein
MEKPEVENLVTPALFCLQVRSIEEELRQHLSSLPDIPSPAKTDTEMRLFDK